VPSDIPSLSPTKPMSTSNDTPSTSPNVHVV
jgi:hypothetical protein